MEHKIEILPVNITNKISAGEVVQRPLSVVKELVENSIDAKSNLIQVDLIDSGLEQIKVIDNGFGMDFENVKLCLTKHATSKVKEEQDIFNIKTLGFRGEALPSIAAVSKLNLKTSTDGIIGYELIKNGDEEQHIKEIQKNVGTTVIVNNLFYNTPARFKHLSSTFYELSLILQYINKAALANTNITFEVKNNSNLVFSSLGDGIIRNVFQKIYNNEVAKNLLEFTKENDDFKVDFYIVKPQITRSKKNNMHISVNNRPIKNMAIENMVINGYGTFLHTNQFPIVYINIHTDPSLIDINIHPTKEQIKISLIKNLEKLIQEGIYEALGKEEYISKPQINIENGTSLNHEEEGNIDTFFESPSQIEKTKLDFEVKEQEPLYNNESIHESNSPEFEQTLIKNGKFVGIHHQTYILYENEDGIFFVDQHAAQERIRYEDILGKYSTKKYKFQKILIPQTMDFTSSEFLLVKKILDDLEKLGLKFEEFGPNILRLVEADTMYLKIDDMKKSIRWVIDTLLKEQKLSYEQIIDEIAISIACKGSIKAHDYITSVDAKALLNDLSKCYQPYTCPHGRPIIVNIGNYELEKMFKRVS